MTICDDLWSSARRELIIGTRYIREVYISDVPAGQRTGVREIKRRTATTREFRVNILLDSRLAVILGVRCLRRLGESVGRELAVI